ncbi:MAG: hypothetical protein K0R49_1403 [Burkholderiales bacterium]|jgi:bifunctional DNA-binding transcriptional regulator/antitoxin component of YhaV-PrlF toxin-antitoxin module|nr:hypothetical protein [Burkholderiales bacterium]
MELLNHAVRYESKVYAKGKTTLPIEIRKKLGIQDNEKIIYISKGNSFEITTGRILLEQMQKKLQSAKDNYSVEDFIADKHKEAFNELKD